jgi:probable F420-dependent oxidoreductase
VSIELNSLGARLWLREATPELVKRIERAGYGSVWLSPSPPGDLALVEQLLDATSQIVVGTSVVNMWTTEAAAVAAAYHRIAARHPDRFLLGVGPGHREVDPQYASPLAKTASYLGELTARGVPADRVLLAALGPKMLELARDQAGGAQPVMLTPARTRWARDILGPGKLLIPGQHVLLDADAGRARAAARASEVASGALHVTNYRASLRRAGFTEADLADPGSDRLIDALVLHGDPAVVAAGLAALQRSGADHVGIMVLRDDPADVLPRLRPGHSAWNVRPPS